MKKILVVDDERLNINVLVELLREDYKMMAAKNGEQALKAVHSANKPDLILLDIMMPGMDGYEVCRQLKADPKTKEIPVMFVSAMSEIADETKGFELGAADYITKPISPAIVQARVKTQLALQDQALKLKEAAREIAAQKERMEEELNVARDIQLSMVPKTFPKLANIDLFAKMVPAREVGGDFYDVFMIDEASLCLCIGDVSGKGAPAALFMAKAKTLINTYASSGLSPAEIMTRTNNALCEGNDSSLFVTVFLSILNISTGTLQFCNAGHNFPYIVKDEGILVKIENQHGPVVGAFPNLDYGEETLQLEKNDTLFIYTDGVTEAMNEEDALYSEARLESYLSSHKVSEVEAGIESLIEEVHKHENGTAQTDDVTLLACHVKA